MNVTTASINTELSNDYAKGLALSSRLLHQYPALLIALGFVAICNKLIFDSQTELSVFSKLTLVYFDQLLDVTAATICTALLVGIPLSQAVKQKPLLILALITGPALSAPMMFAGALPPVVAFVLGTVAVVSAFALHFVFVPILFGETKPLAIIQRSLDYVKRDKFLPVRVIFPALLVQLFVLGLTKSLAPETTSTLANGASALAYAGEKILVAILSAGYAVAFLPLAFSTETIVSSTSDITIEAPRPKFLRTLLEGNRRIAFATVCLWLVALLRFQTASLDAPPTSLTATFRDREMDVVFVLPASTEAPPLYAWHFSLRTEKGKEISATPRFATVDGEPLQDEVSMISRTAPREVKLTFSTTRSKLQLEQLNSLYLWYRAKPVLPVRSGGEDKALPDTSV